MRKRDHKNNKDFFRVATSVNLFQRTGTYNLHFFKYLYIIYIENQKIYSAEILLPL